MTISPFCTIRRPILFSIFVTVNPGASFFTIYLKQEKKKTVTHACKKENNPK
jgi:hypothetical protein